MWRSCRAGSEDAGQEALSWRRRGDWMCPPISQKELFWSVLSPGSVPVGRQLCPRAGAQGRSLSLAMCISATKKGINTLFCLGTPFNLLARFSYTSPDSQQSQA